MGDDLWALSPRVAARWVAAVALINGVIVAFSGITGFVGLMMSPERMPLDVVICLIGGVFFVGLLAQRRPYRSGHCGRRSSCGMLCNSITKDQSERPA